MKIKQEDYKRLEALIQKQFELFPVKQARATYHGNLVNIAWHYFHIAQVKATNVDDYTFLRSLHEYLTDDQIETALRKIVFAPPAVVKIETVKQPDIVDLIIQQETEGFETREQELIFVKAVVEAGVTSALPGHTGHIARQAYAQYKLADRHWRK